MSGERIKAVAALFSPQRVMSFYSATLFAALSIEVVLASVFVAAGGSEINLLWLYTDRLTFLLCIHVLVLFVLASLLPGFLVLSWPKRRTVQFAPVLWGVLLGGAIVGYTYKATQFIQMVYLEGQV